MDALVKRMEETAQEPAGQMVFISHGDCLEAVSYTHLDVYKRQLLFPEYSGRELLSLTKWQVEHLLLD